MKIKLLFFGIINEIAGCSELILVDIQDTDQLTQTLKQKYPGIIKVTYRIAVNKIMINENVQLRDGDEIAFLPPFAGG